MDLFDFKSLAIAATLLCSSAYNAAADDVNLPSTMEPLTESEMNAYHGGFVAPGGLEIDIGFTAMTEISPTGIQSGTSALAATTSLANNSANPSLGSLVQYTPNGVQVLVQNSLSNLTVQTTTQLNVDVANYSQLHGQLAVLGQNLINSVSGLPH